MKKCKDCSEKDVARNGNYCRSCYEKRVYIKRKQKIPMTCKRCGTEYLVALSKKKYYENKGGATCKTCRAKISSETFIKTRGRESVQERKMRTKAAHDAITPLMRHIRNERQWETIRRDKDKYKSICKLRSNNLKKMWEQMDADEKNRRVVALFSGQGKRSKVSDMLKEMMISEGIYDGFVSEVCFCGFYPDEMNKDKKIIVEMYGDTYHCNPKKFDDPLKFIGTIGRTVGEQWQRDKRRLGCFYAKGYKVIIIWESDFRNNPQKEISRIKMAL